MDLPGTPPSPEALRTRTLERVGRLPALHQLATPAPRWGRATLLDGDLHIRVRDIAPGRAALDAAATELLRTPLPSGTAPMWDIWLLRAPGHDGYRLCFRVHHALQDGVGAAHTVTRLLADDPGTPGPHAHRPVPATLRGLTGLGRDLYGSLRRDRHWRMFGAPPAGDLAWACVDAADERLRLLAARWGGTVNDMFLSALARAFRAWHAARPTGGAPCADVTAVVPMSVRRKGEEHLPGNRLVFARVPLPCSQPGPAECVRRLVGRTGELRTSGQRELAGRLFAWPPASATIAKQLALTTPRISLIASNVHLPHGIECFGSPVVAASMFTALPRGVLCYVSLTRTGGTARCTVVHDKALPGAAALPGLWLDALAELEASAPV
ncbi:wax ester/triacylglycerol synthase domain-containing protein [Streptomyces sp. RFCAC02]|uniref:wax ester/triacylglycerol synthase domain-containing protein n=1 Tax=Streptomyces sp. RFCAC02 TaxID=2499143 RepID=UPI00143DCADC|nr:wax ester/triacylglycerol synthase domain-containing protein [Streptomyces sp. RFCAC02]